MMKKQCNSFGFIPFLQKPGTAIIKWFGFNEPIVNMGYRTEWIVEQSIVGVATDEDSENVVTLILDKDRVCGMHGPASIAGSASA